MATAATHGGEQIKHGTEEARGVFKPLSFHSEDRHVRRFINIHFESRNKKFVNGERVSREFHSLLSIEGVFPRVMNERVED